MRQLIVEPEFRDKIPALSPEEFSKLEENILADGEVRDPLVVWNNTIIDGHNRWAIIQKHPDLKWSVKQVEFPDKWAAIAWMCRNQLGRRNLNELAQAKLIQEEHDALSKSVGAPYGNSNARKQFGQNSQIVSKDRNQTRKIVAEEHNMSTAAVRQAVEFGRGLDAAEKDVRNAVFEGISSLGYCKRR